ncbi:hypothetical protein HCN44_003568 [Aphidius gifuensis]|uniref:Uncharacterized protein n=1 Tax=Aphidius gifuensis TaxID=684658 RepID=A0A834XJ30_APHGI|nr:TELO2-interacting protein 2-like [Aphidius gifuensis]XP_044018077.1 TELO2-interacting protein 2-like [Aphidius gifuensis]KAF7987705.1 hypothetical protein HCN44_003568 [Aphidius gifuensis]
MANIDDLSHELEKIGISSCSETADSWRKCSDLINKTHVPQQLTGHDRPCEEKDFQNYHTTLINNLQQIQNIIQQESQMPIKKIGLDLILVIGEQSEKNPWTTDESLKISQLLLSDIYKLFGADNVSQILCYDDNMTTVLTMLRQKLLKDNWKTYPAAVTCYKWILNQTEIPQLSKYLSDILPTALIIFDDYIPENRLIGLECIYRIIQHSTMQKEFIENGYADVIYDAVERLAHHRDSRYTIPLYACITQILANIDQRESSTNHFEWTRRDDVISTLLDNMELEQDLELRHAYMLCLPQLLTNLGCAKWCERLTRVLSEYCSHHTDLRTLKATLLAAETVLSTFQLRIPAHCTTLYSAFLKLHFDLTETPIFDNDIINSLERCIQTLYKLTPNIGSVIIRDDRMKNIINNSVQFSCTGDIKYCN